MAIGKKKCKILKEIRKAIADANDIEYVISECKFQGECRGTCPRCEAEVRYLENELEKRRASGKKVAIAGIATAMVLSTGCNVEDILPLNTQGEMEMEFSSEAPLYNGAVEASSEGSESFEQAVGQIEIPSESTDPESSFEEIDGEIPDISEVETMGDPLPPEESEELSSEEPDYEILGEAYIPDEFFNSGDTSEE